VTPRVIMERIDVVGHVAHAWICFLIRSFFGLLKKDSASQARQTRKLSHSHESAEPATRRKPASYQRATTPPQGQRKVRLLPLPEGRARRRTAAGVYDMPPVTYSLRTDPARFDGNDGRARKARNFCAISRVLGSLWPLTNHHVEPHFDGRKVKPFDVGSEAPIAIGLSGAAALQPSAGSARPTARGSRRMTRR
jgi:hypothetical protein